VVEVSVGLGVGAVVGVGVNGQGFSLGVGLGVGICTGMLQRTEEFIRMIFEKKIFLVLMMLIIFITFNSSLVPLIEGL